MSDAKPKMACPQCSSEVVEATPEDCDTGVCAAGGGLLFRCHACGHWWTA